MKRRPITNSDWESIKDTPVAKDVPNLPPGIYHGIPFHDYLRIDAVSRSSLAKIKQSLAHFKYSGGGVAADESPALAFGTLCHHGRLEPEELTRRYVVIPDSLAENLKTADGKPTTSKNSTMYRSRLEEFLKQHPGKQEVSQAWMEQLGGILSAINSHPKASLLFSSGKPEVTLVWEDYETKVRCKARIDWLYEPSELTKQLKNKKVNFPHEDFKGKVITDLKTTQDCVNFWLDKWDYQLQPAWYRKGWFTLTGEWLPFWFVVAESKQPNCVRAAPVHSNAVEKAENEVSFLLRLCADAKKKRKYPGPADPKFWNVHPSYRFDTEHLNENS